MVQWLSVECLSKQWNSNRLPSDSSGPEICPQGPCFPVFPHLSAQMCWGCWQSRLHSFPLLCQQGLLHVIRVSASAWPFWPQSLKTSLAHDLAYFYHAPHLWMAHKYTGYLFNPYLSAFFFSPKENPNCICDDNVPSTHVPSVSVWVQSEQWTWVGVDQFGGCFADEMGSVCNVVTLTSTSPSLEGKLSLWDVSNLLYWQSKVREL